MSVAVEKKTSVRKAMAVYMTVTGSAGTAYRMRVPTSLAKPNETIYALYFDNALVCQDKDKNKLRRIAYSIRKNINK